LARRMKVLVDDHWYVVELDAIDTNPVRVLVDGESVEVAVEGLPAADTLGAAAVTSGVSLGLATVVRAPMLGVIVSVAVQQGDQVNAGDQLCVLEAIKLQQAIRAPIAGVVRGIHVQPGENVTAGKIIAELG